MIPEKEISEVPALAKAVIDGLARMVADFRERPVDIETLKAARDSIAGALAKSKGHERAFGATLRSFKRQRSFLRRYQSVQAWKIEDSVEGLIKNTTEELRISKIVSKANRVALAAIDSMISEKRLQVKLAGKRGSRPQGLSGAAEKESC